MAAVINCSAGFRRVVDGAEVLPFAGAHFGARGRGAGRVVGEEGDDDGVCFLNEEAAEFVEPDVAGGVGRWGGEFLRNVGVDGLDGVTVRRMGVVPVEGFEVFSQLEGGVDLVGLAMAIWL